MTEEEFIVAQLGYVTRGLKGTHIWKGGDALCPTLGAKDGSNFPVVLMEDSDDG